MIMNGFKLQYKKQTLAASIENGTTSITMAKASECIHLDFRGFDRDSNQHITWLKAELSENETVKIEVVEVDKSADILFSEPNTIDSLERKLWQYNGMRKYLEREGLIEKTE